MLQNISVRFDPVEDRLLLRIVANAEDPASNEHWLHLTRRVCVAWRKDLQTMVDLSAQAPERLDATARAMVSSAHHQAMASQAGVRTEATVSPTPMPNRPPALVTHVTCGRRRSDARWLIRFNLRDQAPLTLTLGGQTLHGLVEALSRRMQTAGWDLAPLPLESKVTPSDSDASHLH